MIVVIIAILVKFIIVVSDAYLAAISIHSYVKYGHNKKYGWVDIFMALCLIAGLMAIA